MQKHIVLELLVGLLEMDKETGKLRPFTREDLQRVGLTPNDCSVHFGRFEYALDAAEREYYKKQNSSPAPDDGSVPIESAKFKKQLPPKPEPEEPLETDLPDANTFSPNREDSPVDVAPRAVETAEPDLELGPEESLKPEPEWVPQGEFTFKSIRVATSVNRIGRGKLEIVFNRNEAVRYDTEETDDGFVKITIVR